MLSTRSFSLRCLLLSLLFNRTGGKGCGRLSVGAGWAHHGTSRCSPNLAPLVLRMLPPQGRRPLRAHRRHPHRGRRRPFSCSPEPQGVAPSRMGQPLRSVGSRTHRRPSPIRKLLVRLPLAGAQEEAPVYAVEASVWAGCDAECSPLLKASTTIPPDTRPLSPSSPGGPCSSSHNWASLARVGALPWTCSDSDLPKTPTRSAPSR